MTQDGKESKMLFARPVYKSKIDKTLQGKWVRGHHPGGDWVVIVFDQNVGGIVRCLSFIKGETTYNRDHALSFQSKESADNWVQENGDTHPVYCQSGHCHFLFSLHPVVDYFPITAKSKKGHP